MKITRHLHSCVELSHEATRIVIDPGSFGAPEHLEQYDAVLATHVHPDHLNQEALSQARKTNPELAIYAPASVAEKLDLEVTVVAEGDKFGIGTVDVEVLGSKHAVVTHATPLAENIGYLFNDSVLHPGDAFHPLKNLDTLLLPVNGPWVKMLDIEAHLADYPPKKFIAIHDGIVNEHGLAINRKQLNTLAEQHNCEYLDLSPGDSVEATS